MKNLLTYFFLLLAAGAMAQTTTPKPTETTTNRKTMLLAKPAPAAAATPNTSPNAVPSLTMPRSQYIMTDGRITGGKTTFKSKKK